MSKRKIAWLATNAEDSCSFYFSTSVIPLLKDDFEIDWIFEERDTSSYDILFYQIENHEKAQFIKELAAKYPGICLYHDLLDPNNKQFFSSDIADAATYTLLTTERSVEEFKRLTSSEKKVSYLPFPTKFVKRNSAEKPAADNSKNRATKICFCGEPEQEWRSEKVLQAISQLDKNIVFYWLIKKEKKAKAEKIISDFPSLQIRLLANKSPTSWHNLIVDADLVIHTLYSAFYDYNPYLPISFAAEVPTITTNFAALEFVPSEICFKVTAGIDEVAQIKEASVLALDKNRAEDKVGAAYRYYQDFHTPESVAAELSLVFNQSIG